MPKSKAVTRRAAGSSTDELPPTAAVKRRLPLIIALLVTLLIAGGVLADYWTARPKDVVASYVGRSACIECHQQETAAFLGSHHDLAMDLATDETVLGDFDGATFEHDGVTSRMFRDGERFMIHTEGPTGEMQDFEVKYVFGVDPLQQYMVEFDRSADMPESEVARLQVLRISWDTANRRWFYLRPPDVDDKIAPDDPLHWTGIGQRWQTMCADCHSTNLQRNYDPKSGGYHTTFSEIDVSCEACHGPGSLHVDLANSRSLFWDRRHGYGLAKLKGDDATGQLESCAPCHSRRGVIDASFHPGKSFTDHYNLELLNEDTYYADGQIKDEVYVFGSFIQSKMYHKGIRCTDCHDPHSLKLKHSGNETCTSCHQHSAGKYDVPSHHHHKPGTAGAMCVNCHMPHRTYMAVDPRRDHSLRVPRPDLSVKLGTPNACTGCHVEDQLEMLQPPTRDKLHEYADWLELSEQGNEQVREAIRTTDRWCEDACERWYGEERKTPPHFAEAIVSFREGEEGSVQKMLDLALRPREFTPAIARATALSELGLSGQPDALSAAMKVVKSPDEDVLVRAAAIGVLIGAQDSRTAKTLVELLEDPSRLIRNEAARVLVESGLYGQLDPAERTRVDLTLREVRKGLMVASDRSGAHMAWAILNERRGRLDEAVEAYETAMRVEPGMTGPRTNLASLLEQMASRQPGPKAAAYGQRAQELRAEELPLLGRDAALAPDNPDLQYRYGLALYLAGENERALGQLEKAMALAPGVPRFATAVRLLKEKMQAE